MIAHPLHLQCKDVVEHVTDLLGDALSSEDVVRLEQHLLVCPPCTSYVAQVRETIALAGEIKTSEPLPNIAALFRRPK
ncbi:MAG: zf-HC2 domain-containing protein [Kofleriaceae bacterium]